MAALLLAACGSFGTLDTETFDSDSGITITTAADVDVYARADGRYSRTARDYLYLAPIETNRQGLHEYFLWVGVASTLDRDYLFAETHELETLFVKLLGEPMEFELVSLEQILPRLAQQPLYRTQLAPQVQLVARISLNQLELLSRELPASLSVRDADGTIRAFAIWDAHNGLARFVAQARGTPLAMSSDFPKK